MLKILVTVGSFLILGACSSAPPVVPVGALKIENGNYQYDEVVQVPSMNANKIHAKVLEWTARSYRSGQLSTQLQDDYNYRYIGKGHFKIKNLSADSRMNFTLQVVSRDERYRIRLYDFYTGADDLAQDLEDLTCDLEYALQTSLFVTEKSSEIKNFIISDVLNESW